MGKEKHLDVEFDTEKLSDLCQSVKEIGISSRKKYRYNISFVGNGLFKEIGLPLGVCNFSFDFPGAESQGNRVSEILMNKYR